ncbi:hypothetical protein AVEN_247489-1 [Araneus ventricosus]|uniref:Uncharacterized protein n=1 Tax=Araneus ventricosus TaxID=182803 RepID=A0A4Y2H0M3_ARAVE|nr:hypothetical protein AVEN_247489-1 [Araneus ventricosus]
MTSVEIQRQRWRFVSAHPIDVSGHVAMYGHAYVAMQHDGDFGTDLVILNGGQKGVPELVHPSPNFRTTPARGRLTPYV